MVATIAIIATIVTIVIIITFSLNVSFLHQNDAYLPLFRIFINPPLWLLLKYIMRFERRQHRYNQHKPPDVGILHNR